jgi:hypothetical protein
VGVTFHVFVLQVLTRLRVWRRPRDCCVAGFKKATTPHPHVFDDPRFQDPRKRGESLPRLRGGKIDSLPKKAKRSRRSQVVGRCSSASSHGQHKQSSTALLVGRLCLTYRHFASLLFTSSDMETRPSVVEWPCDMTVASAAVERALAPIVLRRGEFGRGRALPPHRLGEIDAACAAHGMQRNQALSLRRQLLRAQPGGMRRVNQSSAMGSSQGQQHVAGLFEAAVVTHLRGTLGLEVMHEEEVRNTLRAATDSGRMPRGAATPDALLRTPAVINGRRVKWVECKLFYGSAHPREQRDAAGGKGQQAGGAIRAGLWRGRGHRLRPGLLR